MIDAPHAGVGLDSADAVAALESAQRSRVVQEARSWLRTPYHHAARLKGVGVDCAMLPAEIYHRAGMLPPIAIDYYPRDWHHNMAAERYLAAVLAHATEIEQPALQPGDFVLFKFGKTYAHGGIVMPPGWPSILHADSGSGYVIETRGDSARLADARCQPRYFTLWGRTLPEPDSSEATARASGHVQAPKRTIPESSGPRLHAKRETK